MGYCVIRLFIVFPFQKKLRRTFPISPTFCNWDCPNTEVVPASYSAPPGMLFLLPTALAFAPGLAPTPRARVVTGRALAPVCLDGSLVAEVSDQALYAGAAAAALLVGGGLYAGNNKKTNSAPSPPPAPVAAPAAEPDAPPPAVPASDWYKGKRSLGTHRSAGRWPGDEKRTLWVPPAGWKRPTKPVISWYDKGQRLTPPAATPAAKASAKPTNFMDQFKAFFESATASAPSSPPPRPTTDWYKGKRSLGTHRSAGRWPGDEKRTLWVPPAGWTPAGKAKPATAGVKSWYDSGARLGPNGVNY